MNDLKLGQLITKSRQRDAVHIAVAPVVAGEDLIPSQDIRFVKGSVEIVEGLLTPRSGIGIVDPFLVRAVPKGEKFWMFLYPNTITSLRHDWTHPAFEPASASKTWLENAAIRLGVTYDDLVADWSVLAKGDYINNGERIRGIWQELQEEFWKHRQIVTGKDVPENKRGGFTCSC